MTSSWRKLVFFRYKSVVLRNKLEHKQYKLDVLLLQLTELLQPAESLCQRRVGRLKTSSSCRRLLYTSKHAHGNYRVFSSSNTIDAKDELVWHKNTCTRTYTDASCLTGLVISLSKNYSNFYQNFDNERTEPSKSNNDWNLPVLV